MTCEHHRIIEQYLYYKSWTKERMQFTDEYEEKYTESLKALALRAPVYEASFAMSNRSALKLYDCLVPKVKELSLFCDRCKDKRDKAGLQDPPITEHDENEIRRYWKNKRIEADNKNLHK